MVNTNPASVPHMSDREIAEETLHILRAFAEALTALGNNPMAKMMIPGGLPQILTVPTPAPTPLPG